MGIRYALLLVKSMTKQVLHLENFFTFRIVIGFEASKKALLAASKKAWVVIKP
jgi:hypothetical protein